MCKVKVCAVCWTHCIIFQAKNNIKKLLCTEANSMPKGTTPAKAISGNEKSSVCPKPLSKSKASHAVPKIHVLSQYVIFYCLNPLLLAFKLIHQLNYKLTFTIMLWRSIWKHKIEMVISFETTPSSSISFVSIR